MAEVARRLRDTIAHDQALRKDNFEKYMHAFMSLTSMESSGCKINQTPSACRLEFGGEPGWDLRDYVTVHRELLERVLKRMVDKYGTSSRIVRFIKRQIATTKLLIDFSNSNSPIFDEMTILKEIATPGSYVLYPWGTKDHQTYIELWHKSNGEFLIRTFNLGAGHNTDQAKYQPTIRAETDNTNFVTIYIEGITKLQNKTPTALLYQTFLGLDEDQCKSCITEMSQTSSNCVVKNLIFAMRQDAVDLYQHEGFDLFKTLYQEMIKESLLLAKNNILPFFNKKIGTIDSVCHLIKDSMQDFTNVPCDEIITTEIRSHYNAIRDSTVRQQSTHAAALGASLSKITSPASYYSTPVGEESSDEEEDSRYSYGSY